MQAPNKVYILPSQHNLQYDNGGEEYIRKGAILEWANGKMTIEGATEGIVGGYDLALKDLIKHIESL